jgi:DNA-binding HxlR family transcriptional regulator
LSALSDKAKQEARIMPVSKKEVSPCPIDAMLSVIDGRWKGTILWRLSEGPMRTGELRRSIPEMTERMLIRHLQELVRDGILIRKQTKNMPPCVWYSISEYGLTLLPVLEIICTWGRVHLERMQNCAGRTAGTARSRVAQVG